MTGKYTQTEPYTPQQKLCLAISDEECAKRKDCKLPDGSRCPAYPVNTRGTRF